MKLIKPAYRLALPLILAVCALTLPAAAAQNLFGMRHTDDVSNAGAGAWSMSAASRLRLISAQTSAELPPGETTIEAGIEIVLDAGWKTYWRNPGDTGIAPDFDFSRSENVASVVVSYPMPHRFDQPGDISFGYKEQVIFPLRVTPKTAGEPVLLAADVTYGACEKLCIPVEAAAQLELPAAPGTTSPFAAAIEQWKARTPASHGAVLERVQPVTDEGGARLYVVVAADEPLTAPVLIAELVSGPARVWLGAPDVQVEGRRALFVFPVKIRKGGPGLHGGAGLAFTFADMPPADLGLPHWSQQFDYHLSPQ